VGDGKYALCVGCAGAGDGVTSGGHGAMVTNGAIRVSTCGLS